MSRSASFIRKSTRLAIYFRDRFTCVWCGARVGENATLDHLDPNGSHAPSNLVTACERCNCTRQDKPLPKWYAVLRDVAVYGVRSRVHRARRRPINRELGRFAARTGFEVSTLARLCPPETRRKTSEIPF